MSDTLSEEFKSRAGLIVEHYAKKSCAVTVREKSNDLSAKFTPSELRGVKIKEDVVPSSLYKCFLHS